MMDPKNVCVRVISLPHDQQRLQEFIRNLERTDLANVRDFRVVSAVNGKRMTDDELKHVTTEQGFRDIMETERMGRRNYHYQLSRGSVGCYMSHLNVLRALMERQHENGDMTEYVAVFEDDARFATGEQQEDRHGILNIANEVIHSCEMEGQYRWDILLLGCLPVKYDVINHEVLRLKRFYGTHAMMIPLRSASRLIHLLGDGRSISQQIDSALSDLAERGQICMVAPKQSILVQEPVDLANPENSNIQLPLIPETNGRDPTTPIAKSP